MALKWTDDKLAEAAKKYSKREDFRMEGGGAYAAAYRKGKEFLDDICSHMGDAFKWTEDLLAKEAMKYEKRLEFSRGSGGAYNSARKMGILDKICGHMVAINWTNKELHEEAKKYSTRGRFQMESPAAYQAAWKMGILDMVCDHMKSPYVSWTDERLAQEAKKYSTRGEFQSGSLGYSVAWNRGRDFLDRICDHMVDGSSGFKRSAGAFLYQFRVVRGRNIYYKVGISNREPEARAAQFGVKDGVHIERTHAIWYECGDTCRKAEKMLHDAAKAKGIQYIGRELMKNGFTEIFTKPLLK